MYQKILVPLDGSQLAECVLAHLDALGKGCLVKGITFVRVVEPFESPSVVAEYPIKPEEVIRINAENKAVAEKYITKMVNGFKYEGVKIQGEVLNGKAAETLAEYASKNGADLIVIATHGRSGVSRWVWGSVADRILRSACVPVLMVRAPGCFPGI
jgi:nucleotide-binding universal stress UspA family protein